MGLLSRLFGPKEPETFEPLSESDKEAISFLSVMRDFNGLARNLKSKNPHVRAFTVAAVSHAGFASAFDKYNSLDAPKDDRAVRLLIPMLKDRDEEVRKLAAMNLESETKRADVARALQEYQATFGEQE